MESHFSDRQKFYVYHLPETAPERKEGLVYEIQMVGKNGLAQEFGYLRAGEADLVIGGRRVPLRVIEAARQQPEGRGDFVDVFGQQVLPKDLGK